MKPTAMRLVLILMLLLVQAPISPSITTTAVTAAHSCSGTGCDWLDPNEMHCGNAYTVASAPVKGRNSQGQEITIGLVELRWSQDCQANWARMFSYVGARDMYVMLQYCDGSEVRQQHAPYKSTYYELANTGMVYGDINYPGLTHLGLHLDPKIRHHRPIDGGPFDIYGSVDIRGELMPTHDTTKEGLTRTVPAFGMATCAAALTGIGGIDHDDRYPRAFRLVADKRT